MNEINEMYNKYLSFYNDELTNPSMVGWLNKFDQDIRFNILLNIGVKNNDSVLDYGCGLGHLVDYTVSNNLIIKYKGIDINPNYIKLCNRRLPDYQFELGDIDKETDSYDWVLASGVFTVKINYEDMFDKINKAYTISNKGVAFNALLPNEEFTNYGFNTFDPLTILSNLKQIYDNVYLIRGYTDDDFTIYITKNPLEYDIK
jgi:cyclopropane fatty-acyl-phospholipid synthase-like methyltransferase